ncbi:peptide-binding protein [Brevundimonas sp. AAP58]|uniref:SH3 domain-containing protein n=1 Tax=Brevundimonas sp. AAP58 TaxID=1523422 RepID=UPI0006B9A046|nr:SH3 domain-containing protein [Brevundimonas sp. AAP58]KPF79754.1 peptide-binding protein [Brevundimonas sp. AAP58]
MSKIVNTSLATAAALAALVTAVPTASMAQANGITNCDAPGGRQQVGAAIGAVLGGIVGSNVARNERTLGTVVGAGAGAAAGSYIGCNQQRARANAQVNSSGAQYRAATNLRIRSGPGTNYRQAGSLSAGQPFTAIGSQGEWVQIAGGGWVNAHYVRPY